MPGLSNLNEKLSSVSRAPERNSAVSLTTVCGSSSLFVQVTVEPALTVSDAGPNMKSLATTIVAAPGLPAANAPGVTVHRSATTLVAIGSNWRSDIDMCSAPSGDRRVAERERVLHDGHAGDAEHLGQLFSGDLKRAGSRTRTGGGLRIGGRAGCVEGHVAFHLLNDLMDVSVQHGH